ncbi:MAG: hypothetical protein A2X64_10365 [Ignavibacteria bacterium GWF2_33_9]|nr:MAG: hypothetical protein A2X64_10365 [Ignavibacteria bacterium GWF2_33_9]
MKINKDTNFLELIPKRKVGIEKTEDNKVKLLIPRFKNKLAQKYLIPKFQSKHIEAKLDEYGSTCITLSNGERNIYEIAKIMKEQFGEKIEPVYERVSKYFGMMHSKGFVELIEKEEN